jgi:hypothetical protein
VISREELELLISGAVQQAALAIESAHGRTLTRTEVSQLNGSISVALRMVADRCAAAKVPPPPPASRHPARFFNPVATQEIRVVTAEAIEQARKTLGQK